MYDDEMFDICYQEAPIEEEHSHVLSNLAADTEYEIRLYCTNQFGRSDLSRTVRASTKHCELSHD